MKNILLAGGFGSVGSVLVLGLVRDGFDVTVVDPGYFGDDLIGLNDKVKIVDKKFEDLDSPFLKDFDFTIIASYDYDYLELLSAEKFDWLSSQIQRLVNDKCVLLSDWKALVKPGSNTAKLEATVLQAGGKIITLGCVYGWSFRVRFDTIINQAFLHIVKRREFECQDDARRWLPITGIHNLYRNFYKWLNDNRHQQAVIYDSVWRISELMIAIRNQITQLLGHEYRDIRLGFGSRQDEFAGFKPHDWSFVDANFDAFDFESNAMIKGLTTTDDALLFMDPNTHPSTFYSSLKVFEEFGLKHGKLFT